MKNTFLILALAFFCVSCHKEEISDRPMSQKNMWNCYKNSEWSAGKIRDVLIGKWQWAYTESYGAPGKGRKTEKENTVIEFFKNSGLQVSVNGKLIGSTNWTIKHEDGELYGLELDSTITTLLYGRILICGDMLEFNNSYIDGSDNYFKKINK